MKLVCTSDTHGFHQRLKLPPGDVLIHAGDFCSRGDEWEAKNFAVWLHDQNYKHKIVISGNHDRIMEKDTEFGELLFGGVAHYLLDSSVVIEGIKFYGSPWQPEFNNWAFNLPRDSDEIAAKWDLIPDDTDVLITHGPPKYILDKANDGYDCGCERLRKRVEEIKPTLSLHGHIHEGRGLDDRSIPGTTIINCSICTANYNPINKPVVVDFNKNTQISTIDIVDF